jgi:hypothetical protein
LKSSSLLGLREALRLERWSWVETAVQICETNDADAPKADASDGSGGWLGSTQLRRQNTERVSPEPDVARRLAQLRHSRRSGERG